MNNIQQKIKNHLKLAILDKDIELKNILRVVIGEFDRKNKNIADVDAINIIKKLYQNSLDQNNSKESNILFKYLPKQLKKEELVDLVKDIIKTENLTQQKDIKVLMQILKRDFYSQYEGKEASIIFKNLMK